MTEDSKPFDLLGLFKDSPKYHQDYYDFCIRVVALIPKIVGDIILSDDAVELLNNFLEEEKETIDGIVKARVEAMAKAS